MKINRKYSLFRLQSYMILATLLIRSWFDTSFTWLKAKFKLLYEWKLKRDADLYHILLGGIFFVIQTKSGKYLVIDDEWKEEYNRKVSPSDRISHWDLLHKSIYKTKRW